MHGLSPHDEIEYWRERAKQSESKLYEIQAQLHADERPERQRRRLAEAESTRLSTLLAERDAEIERLNRNAETHREVECKRVALIERINDERFKWRNWSDEVAPPFGSDRDRSDEGQRKAISAQLAKRDAEVGRLQLLLACATRERDLRIERAVATAKQRDSALADVERMRAVFEAAVRWRAARRARHDASVQHEVMPWHRVECTQSEDALMDAIDTDTKAGAR